MHPSTKTKKGDLIVVRQCFKDSPSQSKYSLIKAKVAQIGHWQYEIQHILYQLEFSILILFHQCLELYFAVGLLLGCGAGLEGGFGAGLDGLELV